MNKIFINIILILIMILAFLYVIISKTEPQLGLPRFWAYFVMFFCFSSLTAKKKTSTDVNSDSIEKRKRKHDEE
ncbi:hypothetical protein [Saccharococcus sp. Marseille-Q5394]|uniref:hypothetical protein n=1 Tax=Saccharococcus sp. Marseille-Q5394 TaxID=2972778 RepID=UPI0021CA951A|nr:hypothetical protein [Saccharococcus sp. Marseille-Q5394]